jgi:hypothetical protein
MDKIKLLTDINMLTMAINYKTDYCVFTRFSGHVDHFEIDIRKSKKLYNSDVCACEIDLRNGEYTIKRLNEAKEMLKEILESGEVDLSNMDYEVEEIRHYKF